MLLTEMNAHNCVERVRSPATQAARQPAVELADDDLWRQTMDSGFRENQPPFHVGDRVNMVGDIRNQEQMRL
jgi:hypothetical protein